MSTPPSSDCELVLSRVLRAPRQLVFDAWTKSEHLEKWQEAPKGFTVTHAHLDIRPDGVFKICMRSPEGIDHWLQCVYREVVPPERLAFTHSWLNAEGKPGKETLVTTKFMEVAGGTELTLKQTGFPSVQSRDGHNGGWTSTLDRLGEYLSTQ
jgi:uncharacterized protein YndB with AHSA1/START domain